MGPKDEVRDRELAEDIASNTQGAISTRFDPDTGRQVKKAALVVLIVLGAAFIVVGVDRLFKRHRIGATAQETAVAVPAVEVVRAQSVGAVQRLTLPGQTAAWHASTIYARVNGYVGKWFVDIGDRVHKGQVLVLIESPDLDAELAGARAQLKAAQAQVQVRAAESEFAKSTYERWRDSPKGVVSEQEREEKRADYDSAKARLASSEADVALDQARVSQYAALSLFKQVTAPFDGVITQRFIDIGNLVTAGSTTATTPLYVMTQNDPMRIFVDVPQSASSDLMASSLPVEIQTIGGGPRRTYNGNVTRTSEAINAQARTLRVEVDVPNDPQTLVPGMYVNVGFDLQPKGLVQVPAAALIFRSTGPEVARVDQTGRVTYRSVTIARDDGNVVELGSGVSPGDELVLNVSSQISEGERVQANLLDTAPGPGIRAAPPAATAKR